MKNTVCKSFAKESGDTMFYDFYTYKHWTFILKASMNGLTHLYLFENEDLSNLTHHPQILKPYVDALESYFKQIPFKLPPMDIKGSAFELSVWNALIQIPYGKTKSYKDISMHIGRLNASRAVGNTVGKNPIMIFIPCHRVIKSDGSIGGFSSDPQLKIELLKLEMK